MPYKIKAPGLVLGGIQTSILSGNPILTPLMPLELSMLCVSNFIVNLALSRILDKFSKICTLNKRLQFALNINNINNFAHFWDSGHRFLM